MYYLICTKKAFRFSAKTDVLPFCHNIPYDQKSAYDMIICPKLVLKDRSVIRIIRFDFPSLHPIGKAKSTFGKNGISIFRQKWLFGHNNFSTKMTFRPKWPKVVLVFCPVSNQNWTNLLVIYTISVKRDRGVYPFNGVIFSHLWPGLRSS